jgi:hypothetical protein
MKLPRIQPKIMGVPVSIETAKDITKAGRDIFLRRFVPDDIKQIRMDICKVCPSWEHTSNRCMECGCQMRVKVSLSSSECPLKKWGIHLNFGDSGVDTTEHEESTE